jgi:hypothetical protein
MADIRIEFRGKEYLIPESKSFAVGELVEDVASLPEILDWLRRPRYFKMSRCVGTMLRFAGARVSDSDVHAELMLQLTERKTETLIGSIYMLTSVLMQGAPEPKAGNKDASSEKDSAS